MNEDPKTIRLSFFRDYLTVAYADGLLDENEKSLISSFSKRLGISDDEINEVVSNSDDIDLYVPKIMRDKLTHLYNLVFILISDGKISDINKDKWFACDIIANEFGLDANILGNMLKRILDKFKKRDQSDVVSDILREFGYPIENIKHEVLSGEILFNSNDHIRFRNGVDISGHNYNCKRCIKIESNIDGDVGYTVTIYNLDGNNPLWNDNVQMSPKQMSIISQTNNKILLKGFGLDSMGGSFAVYGLTVYLVDGQIDNVVLHMYDKIEDIKYLK